MRHAPTAVALLLAAVLATTACGAQEGPEENTPEETTMAAGDLSIASKNFGPNERIPQVHAYPPEGENVSPQLSWSGVPEQTKELALVVDDPDAPREEPWVHWLLYRIPPTVTEIPQGASGDKRQLTEPRNPVQGINDFDDLGWGGPLPPEGHGTHHYHFKLYALDRELDVGPGAAKADLLDAMEGHVLAETELVGTYSR